MSDDIAVRVDNIGKQYRIGTRRAPGTVMMREVLTDLAAAPFRKLRALARRLAAGTETLPQPAGADHIWALRNVSFTVPRGQVIGIIGPTGPARAPCSRSCRGSPSRPRGGSRSTGASARSWRWERASIPSSPDSRTCS